MAMFKALNEGAPQKIIDDIKSGTLFEDDLRQFLAGDATADTLHRFTSVIEDIKKKAKCKECFQNVTPELKDRKKRKRKRRPKSATSGR